MEKEYILSCFSNHKREMGGLNNIKVHTAIFTDDSAKAERKLLEIYNNNKHKIEQFANHKDSKWLRLVDGARYLWIRPNDASRGYRFSHLIIDQHVSMEIFHKIILPCAYACSKDDVEIF